MVLNSEVLWQITQPPTEIIREAQSKGTYLTGCSAGFTTLSVLSDGTVYPCRRLPIPIGKINEGISNLIVENEVMQDLRNLKKMEENIGCNKITHCRGCRAVAYAVTGDYMSKDPMCFKKFMGKND
jgi:AdoMet-dependent heme synthase